MKRRELLQVFEIARDLAIAEHKHWIDAPLPKRRGRAASTSISEELDDLRETERLAADGPSVQRCFEKSVAFMKSELAGANDSK